MDYSVGDCNCVLSPGSLITILFFTCVFEKQRQKGEGWGRNKEGKEMEIWKASKLASLEKTSLRQVALVTSCPAGSVDQRRTLSSGLPPLKSPHSVEAMES
jgi:hypothetical protein